MAEIVQVAAVTEDSGDGMETVSDETCGEAAIVARRVHVDIMDDNTDLLAKEVEYVANEVAESEDLTLTKTVRTRIFEAIKEFHEMGQSGALSPVWRDREGFHGVERPMLTNALAVQRECVSLECVDTKGRTRSMALFDTGYGNRSIKDKVCSEVRPYHIEWPMALLGNFWLQRSDHIWRRGRGSLLGVYMQQVAGLENFWLFWIWHPGLLCKQHRTLGRNADEGSVTFDMSDTLVDRIEGAKASCEAAFEVVYDKLQELEDHAKDGEELSTTTEDSDSDDGIDDPEKYFWQCEFCPAGVDTRAALKAHVDAKHLTDIFRFLCCQCEFGAKGPKDLMEHIVKTHGNRSAWSAATIAIIEMQLSNPQDTGGSTSRQEEADKEPCTNREIVTLDTTDLSESNAEDTEIVVLDATDISH
jgi:hypothetical protein